MSRLVSSLILSWAALGLLGSSFQLGIQYGETVAAIGLVAWSYFLIYGGLTRLIMLMVPRAVAARVMVGLLIQLFLVATGSLLPIAILMFMTRFQQFSYGWHQAMNPFWTIADIGEYGITSDNTLSMVLLPLLAAVIFGLNLVLCGRDVMFIRIEVPHRLEEEKAQTAEPPQVPDPFS